jgi:hypothetical protein
VLINESQVGIVKFLEEFVPDDCLKRIFSAVTGEIDPEYPRPGVFGRRLLGFARDSMTCNNNVLATQLPRK